MRRRRPSASTQPRAAWRSIIRDILLSSAPLSTNEKRVGMLEREGPLELSSSRQIALCGLLGTLSIGKRPISKSMHMRRGHERHSILTQRG